MKRRALLAVLPVIVVVAAGVGGSTSADPGAGEKDGGGPWTGSRGVTVPVSALASHQRLADWGFAGRPPRGRDQPEAERELEAAGDAETNVEQAAGGGHEEPVEPHAPPRRPSTSSVQAPTGERAIAPASELSAATSFLGAHRIGDATFRPPDSMGSVGPTQIVVAVNGKIKVFDKTAPSTPALDVTDSTFWTSERDGLDITDPEVEYDRLSGRWILSQINFDPADDSMVNNRIMLAVSDGPEINSLSDFTFYSFRQNDPNPGPTAQFADYPQMGVDANAVYIGTNEFSATGGFTGTTAYVIRKSSVLSGGPIVVTAFRNLAAGTGPGPFPAQPAQDMDPGVDQGYIIGVDNATFGRLMIRRISDPGGTPTISGNIPVAVPATTFPEPVPAQGSPHKLDALDDRLFEAMIGRDENGTLSLWTAHNIEVDASGAASGTGNRNGARWYQIGNLGSNSPTLLQRGTLFDPASSNPRFFWIPSIAMNGQGHASLNASTAGSGRFAQIASSAHLASDPPNTTEPFDITQTSSSTYNLGDTPERWGDYSQTVVDPTDNQTFWTFQEYTHGTDDWGLRVIQLKAPPPATPSTATPSTVSADQCSVGVDIVGTSTNGSGFFDPGPDPGGPGYQKHLAATVTGGIAVNKVTYTDPTHISLDLDTRGASAGAENVTITNPDGQSVTATGLITVGAGGSSATPCVTGSTPASPADDNSPLVFGTADPGSTVTLYSDSTCTTAIGSGTAAQFNDPGIPVTVLDDTITQIYAKATQSMTTSPCSSTLNGPGASLTYVEDSTNPVVSINGGPTGLTSDATPTFSFTASDNFGPIAVECSIDKGTPVFTDCSGASTDTPLDPLADGSYTFRVRVTDGAGHSTTATRTFQVDTTPPSVSIGSGPSGPTNDPTPTFSFSATDAHGPIAFQCSMDAGAPAFGACSGPGTDTPPGPLADGAYIFRVRATDVVSNSATATRSFSVKTAAPDTVITKAPKKKTRKRRPPFAFTSNEVGVSFRCQLDRGARVPCSSPFRPRRLKLGKHSFSVQAVDSLGNADATPATKKFKVLPPLKR
ncbi:MAG TPA: Ig-like domain-containing protein [Solirubrobacterales bacterium]|nr:Ig-like domain-containing protein [Solirubrobacterales bacterium]